MEHAGTLETQGTPKASDMFPSHLVWVESFCLFASAVLVLFAPPSVLNIVLFSGLALLWLSISRSIAEYRNTNQISRQKLALKLTAWGYPLVFLIGWGLKRLVDLPSLSDGMFWIAFLALAVAAVMPRRFVVSRFGDDEKQVLNNFQTAAKERYRGWVPIYAIGAAVLGCMWVVLSATAFISA